MYCHYSSGEIHPKHYVLLARASLEPQHSYIARCVWLLQQKVPSLNYHTGLTAFQKYWKNCYTLLQLFVVFAGHSPTHQSTTGSSIKYAPPSLLQFHKWGTLYSGLLPFYFLLFFYFLYINLGRKKIIEGFP